MKDMVFKNRDDFFQFIVTANIKQIREVDLNLREVLQDCKKYNLLCDNEVEYFYENNHHKKPDVDFLNDIQQRLLLHRVEELKIKNAKIKKGGFISVANGSRVQGTVHVGGMQPDYIIDSKSSQIQELIKSVSYLLEENIPVWNKIDIVGNIIREQFIERTEYDDPLYVNLLKRYKDNELEIPLSEYVKVKRGVCREISLLTVLALNSINIESYYYYAKVETTINNKSKEEDHAVVIVNINDNFWVIDNYFRVFNKNTLDNVLSGIENYSGLMYDPIEEAVPIKGKIMYSRLYPETKHNCNYIS